MTMLDSPYEAGLGAFVRLGKASFIGRDALTTARESATAGQGRRLRTVRLTADDAYQPVYGGEAVRLEGEVVGRLRSVNFGATVGATVGFVYLDRSVAQGTGLEVDVFDERIAAEVSADVLVDPNGDRMAG